MKFALGDLIYRAHSALVAVRRGRVARHACDPWDGIARDLIDRFMDIQCARHGLSRSSFELHRAQLEKFDSWMMHELGRTLVTAQPADVRRYIEERVQGSGPAGAELAALCALWSFYRFLRQAGCRSDDPLEQVLIAPPPPIGSAADVHQVA